LLFEQTQIETESNHNRVDDRADFARVDSVPSPHGVWGALGTIGSGDDTQNWDRY